MKEQIFKPKLRFPEFTEPWEKTKLGNISDKVMYGMNSAAIEFDGVNKYLRITDIDESSREFMPNPLVSPDGEIQEKYKLKNGDIVFTRTGASVGKTYLYNPEDGNLLFAGFLIKFSINNDNPYFIFAQTLKERYNRWVLKMSMRSGQPGLNAEECKEINLFLSSNPEQAKIASFLSAVDDKLQILKKKKNLLEDYKKGVMQKIFSQELRFKDENGNMFPKWTLENGNSIFETVTNKDHNSDLPILAITQEHGAIPRNLIEYNISVTDKSIESYKVVEVGDFIISLRSFQGGIEYSNYKGICSPAYIILRPYIDIDRTFFKYFFKTTDYIRTLNKTLEGIRDGKMISYKNFSEVKLPFPSKKEQTKIAQFFSIIDDKINHTQTQMGKTDLWKKGLLQKMFV